jgi:AcrR family transcriptional regulator
MPGMAQGERVPGQRRARILDAALECFLAKSVGGTTIDDVRRSSGASTGSIYHFFGSKEGLASALYRETLADYQAGYLAALRRCTGAEAGITSGVHSHLQWVAARPDRARYLFHWREPEAIGRTDEPVAELNERFYAAASNWLQPHVDAARIRPLTPRLCQALWMGPTIEYARLWLSGAGRRFDLLAGEPELAHAAWESMRTR